ncbi:MAG: hypothetical protein ACXWLH_03880 [Candidatus Saccharimonadales bacterium]
MSSRKQPWIIDYIKKYDKITYMNSYESLEIAESKSIRQRMARKIMYAVISDPRTVCDDVEAIDKSLRVLDIDAVAGYGRVFISLTGGIKLWVDGKFGQGRIQLFTGGTPTEDLGHHHTFSNGNDLDYYGDGLFTVKDNQELTPADIATLHAKEVELDDLLSAVELSL